MPTARGPMLPRQRELRWTWFEKSLVRVIIKIIKDTQ